MRLRHCPPISTPTNPYAFTPLPLPSLRARGALPTCLRHCLTSLYASAATNHPYACFPPDMLPTPLTILMLVESRTNMPPTPLTTLMLV
ncbi:hypothetical protein O181_046945 [Austropuccinia psidii MF-1]|uniref:Uncharacterized protein n=1 Tax=Austropuccinia psidii MF-1 TaxID=1389203 RepID=A0A9Q3DUD9_9BASI|nr:hypothetical protein [Austropuccinia psidii MF-1]